MPRIPRVASAKFVRSCARELCRLSGRGQSGRARLSSLVATLAVFLVLASGFALVRARAGERFPWPESLSRIFGSRSTRTVSPAPIAAVYTWNAAGSGLFNTASNWTPDRTSPATTDIIVFDNGGTITASNVQSQTIGELQIKGGTNVTLQAVANDTLTISPGLGALAIANGSQLSTSGVNVLNFSLPGATTGSTSGVFTVTSGNSLINSNPFTVNNGGFLKGGGSVTGPVSVSSGGTIAPGTSAGILSTGNVTFSSGSTYAVEIGGTAPGTGHDQLNVTGTVSLGGATLSISGSYIPTPGDSFMIVNNDGSGDPVVGTFNGLLEGATVSVNGTNKTITYTGGDGNDVVLQAICVPPSTVYVDDDWSAVTPGTDPDGGGPATNFGCDSFATIQNGINGVAPGGTVIVYAGTYKENPNANKAVTIQGPNAGTAGSAVRGAEATVISNGNQNAVFTVSSNNVTIDGFMIDGDDPLATLAPLKSGDDTNVSYGVRPSGAFNHIVVQNNIIKRAFIGFRGDGASQNNLITANWFDSIGNFDFGYCVSLRQDFYADITNNKMTRAWTGVHINDHHTAGGPANFNISNNEIHSYAGGILYWLNYNAATGATINGNTITAESGAVANNFGLLVVTLQNAVSTTITSNTISGHNYGVGLFNVPTSSTITLGSTNSITNSSLAGVFLTDNLNFNPIGTTNFLAGGPGAASTVNLTGMSITGNTGDGLKIEGTTNTQNLVAGGNTVTGSVGTNGVEVIGPAGTANLTGNNITGFATGIALTNNSGTQTMSGSFNRIISGTNAYTSAGAGSFAATLENNWWGCNAGPGNTGCGAVTGSGVDSNPWIVLGVSATGTTPGGNSTVTADMTHNSDNVVPGGVTALPLPNAAFSAPSGGTIAPPSNSFTSGQSQSTFTSNSTSNGQACAAVDNQTTCTAVTVTLPSFSIDDVALLEGNSGTTAFTFTITKTGATTFNASVDYATVDGSAKAPTDYTAIPSTNVVFLPSDTTKQVIVQVKGDTTFEVNETFTVHLSGVVDATISDADGLGTINNDDTCASFSTVYVDDSWAGTAIGDDPDGGGPATVFGCDSFATIQEGVNAVTSGGNVIVADGSYTENVTISKPVVLKGAQFGVDARGRSAPESSVTPATASTATFLLNTTTTTTVIDGFTFTGGTSLGVIQTQSGTDFSNLQIRNNRFSNYSQSAVFLNRSGSDITIDQNVMDGSSIAGSGQAIFANGPQTFNGLFITNNNIINNSGRYGFFVDGNHNVGESATRAALISGNLFNNNLQGLNLGSRSFGKQTTPSLGTYAGTISNNTFSNHTANGIQAGIQHVLVSGNTFTNNALSGLSLTSFGNTGADRGAQNSTIVTNTFTGNGGSTNEGVLFSASQAVGTIATNHFNFNRVVGNNKGATYNGTETIDIENNWWGCNLGPGNAGCDAKNGTGAANLDSDPWIVLGVSASPNPIPAGGTSTVTADMTHNSDGAVPSLTTFIPQVGVSFSATNGSMAPPTGTITSGQATSTFTSANTSDGQACAQVDNEQVCTAITISPEIAVEEPIGNDLTDNSATVGFGNQTLNTASAPKTFTIRNTGGGTLTISAITVDGANPGDFSVDTTGMSPNVGAGGNTAFTVTFTPTALGARSAVIHIANNDSDENPFDIALTGNGDCPTTLTVNDSGDDPDATPGDGICETATGNGFCSLRAAIMESNALTSCAPLTINFNLLPGSEPQLIILSNSLPPITRSVTIQGPVGQMVSVDGNQSYRIFEISSATNVTISNLIIQNASEANNGAGLLNSGSATVNLFNLAFTGNQNDDANGGAIYNASGTLNIWNCTIANNLAQNSGKGGGIYNDSGTVKLTNDTISANGSDTAGGGVYNNAGTVSVRNTIIAGNPSPGWDIFGAFTSQGHNIIGVGDTGTGFTDGINNDRVGTQTTPFDPQLDLFDDHGGATLTFSLLPNSPAIDGGDDCVLTGCTGASPSITTDQRSVARPQGAHVDIGAFEFATYVVNTTADHAPGLCEALPGGDCTLREAINAANGNFFGPSRIAFGIPTDGSDPGCVTGVCTIALDNTQGVLPEITTQVFIDGYTQTGATPNTLDLGDGDNAALKIVLNGANLGAGAIGLDFCTGGNNSTVQGLVVNSFQDIGIWLDSDGSIHVQGNFIGTDVTGMLAVANGTGISVSAGLDNFVGGEDPAARNIISGNTGDGVRISGDSTGFTSVEGNYIGTTRDGASALANNIGVNLFDFTGANFIGCETENGDNVISGNTSTGIRIKESAFNLVQGNRIGTDKTGELPIANGVGVDLCDAPFNAIGADGFGNLISGNTGAGVRLRSTVDSSDPSSDNVIYGNKIGTNFQGLAAIPNDTGILIQISDFNDIGSGDPQDRNLISGNTHAGIRLENSSAMIVFGNLIGTDVFGSSAIANGAGVEVSGGSDNEIGCTVPGSGNVISGNTGDGVAITGSASYNFVQSDFIGVQGDGTSPLANGGVGVEVYIGATNNVIGADFGGVGTRTPPGANAKTNSRVSSAAPAGGGCSKRGTSHSQNTKAFKAAQQQKAKAATLAQKSSRFAGRAARSVAAAKALAGAKVKGAVTANKSVITPSFVITGANVIANNGEEGIKVSSSGDINNLISQNSIYANGKLGINLVGGSEDGNGVTANDTNDGDSGPNLLQNYPVITSAITNGSGTTINGTLNSGPDQEYLIEFFASSDPLPGKDPSGFGEGQTYIGSTSVTTSGNDISFSFNPASSVPAGSWVTATAIDGSGNTSEFSGAVQVAGPTVSVTVAPSSVLEDGATNLVYSFTRNDPSTPLTANFAASGTADSSNDYTIVSDPNVTFNGSTGTVTFGIGISTVSVTVDPTSDPDAEPDETVTLAVTSGTGYVVGVPGSATGTITNDDCPTTFTVNSNADTSDATPGDGVCKDGSNSCSLRAAIQEANALASCGPITIDFAIGNNTITLGSQLIVDHNVNITGPPSNSVMISGNNLTRLFTINLTRTVSMSSLTLTGGNGSGGDGGAIQNSGTLTLNAVTLNGNSAVNGGAIRSDGALVLTNTTISGNNASGDGGGLYHTLSTATLTNVTVAYNRADNDNNAAGTGGGVSVAGGTVLLHNTIVADNYRGGSPSTTADNIGGTVDSSSSYNLVGNGSGGLINGTNNNQVGVATALLGALMDNNGPTLTHGLLYNSPAIDAGDDAVLGSPLFINVDQRGLTRPANGDLTAGSHVDIGAYERQATEMRSPAASGANITLDINDVRLTFPCYPAGSCAPPIARRETAIRRDVLGNDIVSLTQVAVPGDAPAGSGPAFDVTPNSQFYDSPVTVCFYLPAITSPATFATLKVMHREGGLLIDHGSVKDFANKTVCTQVNSFSEFVLAQSIGPTATNATVTGQILDDQGHPVEGAAVRLSGTQNRLAITDADGKYHFDEVETNGFYVVTPARANFTFSPGQRSFSQLGATTEATFTASATGGALNPLDTTEYFVRQQYLDFLGREPDNAGFNFWVNNIESCGNNLGCREVKRIDTSAAFFLSIESQQTGYLAYRTYQAAYGDLPNAPVPVRLSEFRTDAALISKDVVVLRDGWQRALENNKKLFAEDFVKRNRFVTAYPTSMSPAEFVDRLFATAGIPQTDGDYSAALGEFGGSADTVDTGARARVLQRLAENQVLSRREFNQAFVLMEYFGYLRRDPNSGQDTDFGGYNFWLDKLDRFHGNFQDAEMVKAFLTSIEYRARFPR